MIPVPTLTLYDWRMTEAASVFVSCPTPMSSPIHTPSVPSESALAAIHPVVSTLIDVVMPRLTLYIRMTSESILSEVEAPSLKYTAPEGKVLLYPGFHHSD